MLGIFLAGDRAQWIQDFSLSFPVLDDSSLQIWNTWKETYIPFNVIVDQNFVIRYREVGFSEAEIRAVIETRLPPL